MAPIKGCTITTVCHSLYHAVPFLPSPHCLSSCSCYLSPPNCNALHPSSFSPSFFTVLSLSSSNESHLFPSSLLHLLPHQCPFIPLCFTNIPTPLFLSLSFLPLSLSLLHFLPSSSHPNSLLFNPQADSTHTWYSPPRLHNQESHDTYLKRKKRK